MYTWYHYNLYTERLTSSQAWQERLVLGMRKLTVTMIAAATERMPSTLFVLNPLLYNNNKERQQQH